MKLRDLNCNGSVFLRHTVYAISAAKNLVKVGDKCISQEHKHKL